MLESIKKLIKWGIIAICILYLLFPIDIIPESLLGPVGLIDDMVVGVIAILLAKS